MRNNRLFTALITISLATLLLCPCGNAHGQEGAVETEEKSPDSLPDPATKLPPISHLLSSGEAFSITEDDNDYGLVLYNIIVSKSPLRKVLENLADRTEMTLTIDDHIDSSMLSSLVTIYLDKTPLEDILEIILGSKGLEYVLKEDEEIWVTFPTKLSFNSPLDYLKDKAVSLYHKAQIKYPSNPFIIQAYYDLGNYYLLTGDYMLAVQEFQTIVESYPSDDLTRHAMINTGKCYEKLADFENARHNYFRFIDTYTRDELLPNLYLSIGDTWYKQGLYSRAIGIYNKLLETYPKAKPQVIELTKLQLGRCHQKLGNYEEALEIFFALGKDYVDSEERKEYRAEVEYHIGDCMYQMGKYEEASEVLGNLLVTELTHPMADDAYSRFADCSYIQGDYFGAVQAYKGLLSSYPDSKFAPHAQYYLGLSYKNYQLNSSAIIIFTEGLEKYPKSRYRKAMEFGLGECYFEQEDYRRARNIFMQYIASGKDQHYIAEAHFLAAECLFNEGKYNEAVAAFKKILTLDPIIIQHSIESVYKRVGDCYKELGQIGKSILAYQGKEIEG